MIIGEKDLKRVAWRRFYDEVVWLNRTRRWWIQGWGMILIMVISGALMAASFALVDLTGDKRWGGLFIIGGALYTLIFTAGMYWGNKEGPRYVDNFLSQAKNEGVQVDYESISTLL